MTKEQTQGGTFGGVDDLYREVILEHYKSPRNKGALPKATQKAEGYNPLCGDSITVSLLIEGNTVKDIKFEGHGCAISQASASMMTDTLKGKTLLQGSDLVKKFKTFFGVQEENGKNAPLPTEEELGDLVALEGIKKYPVRIKCALLAWNTFLQTLTAKKDGK